MNEPPGCVLSLKDVLVGDRIETVGYTMTGGAIGLVVGVSERYY